MTNTKTLFSSTEAIKAITTTINKTLGKNILINSIEISQYSKGVKGLSEVIYKCDISLFDAHGKFTGEDTYPYVVKIVDGKVSAKETH